ncbi:MAG TPA: D-alanyl-D-alanine carboxypeptidase/D-alanyl-D-alanine-endopeptidase [Bryobacteraceae bacterium]|nr:D-alanyl-D-alanine carboxypeptidase/D-alanyl-D-alanine-endopeptidase [Bryobacteraceae bacterium]
MRVALLFALAASLHAADLGARLDRLIDSSPAFSHAFLGMRVVRLSDGRLLYSRNAERLFVPASNMKLFTSALALAKLGADYRLTTQIGAAVPIDAEGTLAGDLDLIGGGDPSLSGREYPYRNHAPAGAVYSFAPMEELVDQLVAHGLKRVEGNIVGDDTRYIWEPQPGGWSADSASREYGAPVSALILHDNTFLLTLHPAEHVGGLARITLAPPFENFVIDNHVATTERGAARIQVYRSASGRELHVWGKIPKTGPSAVEELAIGDPALYAAEVLRDALARRGIPIRGEAVARHRFPDENGESPVAPQVALAEHKSPPLLELLQVVDKVSQNLHAEVLLRETAVAVEHTGSREAGLAAMDEYLAGLGITRAEYQFTDGSGLSPKTLVSPAAIVKLLAHMYASPHREAWLSMLPVGGEDGTLERRFEGHPEARAIHAKTGTLDHVKAISGYADTEAYGRVAFSLLVNHFEEPSTGVSKAIDGLVLDLLR